MDKNAHLGGFEKILRERPDYAPAIAKSLEDLAEKQGYPGLLARGMLDSKIAIHRVSSRVGKLNMRRFMDEKELDEDRRSDRRWQDEGEVKKAGQLLVLDSRHAAMPTRQVCFRREARRGYRRAARNLWSRPDQRCRP